MSLVVPRIQFSAVLLATNKSVKVVDEKKRYGWRINRQYLALWMCKMVTIVILFVYLYLPFFVAAHITVHSQQGAIAIAIRSPSKASASSLAKSNAAAVFTSESHQPAIFGNPNSNSNCLAPITNFICPAPDTYPICPISDYFNLGLNDDAWWSQGAFFLPASSWRILCCYEGA